MQSCLKSTLLVTVREKTLTFPTDSQKPAWKWLLAVCETYATSHKKPFAPSISGFGFQKLIYKRRLSQICETSEQVATM